MNFHASNWTFKNITKNETIILKLPVQLLYSFQIFEWKSNSDSATGIQLVLTRIGDGTLQKTKRKLNMIMYLKSYILGN